MAVTVVLPKLKRYARADYQPIAARLKGVTRTAPNKRGWGSGWPDCQGGKMEKATSTRQRDGAGFNRPMRREIVALTSFLLQETLDIGAQLGYEFRKAIETDGGVSSFVCRAIKNSSPPAPSLHSWGLAIDINSRSNPMSKTWQATNPPWMVDLWESAGFFWGGRFTVPPWFYDAMHFEYNFRPADVATDLANARAAAKRIRAALLPKQPALDSAKVKLWQQRLVVHGFPVTVDGIWGPQTEAAVKAFQEASDLVVDGIVGPITSAALAEEPEIEEPEPPPLPPEPPTPTIPELQAEIDRLQAQVATAVELVPRVVEEAQRVQRVLDPV